MGTGASLLLVDDEAALTGLLKHYLERVGYRVDACTNPEAALELLDAEPHRHDLVITDLTLAAAQPAAPRDYRQRISVSAAHGGRRISAEAFSAESAGGCGGAGVEHSPGLVSSAKIRRLAHAGPAGRKRFVRCAALGRAV
jgi:hypothetical protein